MLRMICCLLCAATLLAEESRGLKPLLVKAPDGKEIIRFTSHQALLIGNSRYTAGWPPLSGVVADVAAVRTALEKQGFAVDVAMDLNRTQMDERISTFVAEKGQDPNGRIVFYYAGHGQTLKNNQGQENGYLVPVDAPVPSESARPAFIAKAYPIQRIKIAAQELGCRHALAVFDACFSGALFAPLRGGNAAVLQQAAEPVRMFITSGSAEEQVPDTSIFREEFVAALTDGVADFNKDGWTTGSELALHLRQQVMGRRAAAGGRQTPQAGISEQSGLNKGDVVFETPDKAKLLADLALPETPAPEPDVISVLESLKIKKRPTVMATGDTLQWAAQSGSDSTGRWAEIAIGNTGQRLRLIPAGGGAGQLWVADSECTQRLWQAVMGANPSTWTGQTRLKELLKGTGSEPQSQLLPVESVSWSEIQTFLGKLNAAVPGLQARLPSEAEWAWAAVGGKEPPANLDGHAWTRDSGVTNPQTARSTQANLFGLHDMLGNVWEWCADGGAKHALRGGGFLDRAARVSPGVRLIEKPDYRSRDLGFRFVVAP